MARSVKYELSASKAGFEAAVTPASASESNEERRDLRSRYQSVKNFIHDEREDITSPNTDKFDLIFGDVESLHQRVRKPREQVADAKALLDITECLVSSVKAHVNDGLTPSDFVLHILNEFGERCESNASAQDCRNSIRWRDLGVAVSGVFKGVTGCSTMIGPMDTEINQRKTVNRRKRMRSTQIARPEELDGCSTERIVDTDENMSTMFNILRENRVVKLENLVLNRNSFAQTVENLFALSFLVKDGRAEIKMNENGWQLVSPRNAPAATEVLSGEVAHSHFVFRFDFKDWKLMTRTVGIGEEMMPHRKTTII
ncbi:non-structural maintenance of chromosomes element 4 homolog A-like [Neltuma alba]|uniref:non-structural maintenance of chromosomes element 4 homolog A-like n=1 Tax=Neltuma alba TaxID=207710 RepID=UPI0010A3A747|nr:non-structural maintenance of chromosomes element 4 homolog A-like [Prosopis alba]